MDDFYLVENKDGEQFTGKNEEILVLFASQAALCRQLCKGAPWAVPETQITGLEGAVVGSHHPRTANANQKELDFQ